MARVEANKSDGAPREVGSGGYFRQTGCGISGGMLVRGVRLCYRADNQQIDRKS